MTPWYLKILQELCPHNDAGIVVTSSCVTCETTEIRCLTCGLVEARITECI